MAEFELFEPSDVADAFQLLDCDDPAVRPMGGGTALMLMMKAGLFKPARLVSLRKIQSRFHGIALSPDGASLVIGGMTTFADLEHSDLVASHVPVVRQTMKTLANPRVRNVATVGGNLAHADPHLDLPPVWTSLDAELVLMKKGGERRIPVSELFAGYYETTLAEGELIAEVHVPVRPDWQRTYVKITTRSAHDWPALGLALGLRCDAGKIVDARIVLSAATDHPIRLGQAEACLVGNVAEAATFERAAQAAADEALITSDDRGAADYKTHLLRVHLARSLLTLAGT